MSVVLATELGNIVLKFRPDAAPVTVAYIQKCVRDGLYDGATFYRSDFVIQCGLFGLKRENPHGDLPVNETHQHKILSNTRGTVSIAHFDVPDNGNTEMFINLKPNAHLDKAYGGYCVFAEVVASDAASFAVVDKIADAIESKTKKTVKIESAKLQ